MSRDNKIDWFYFGLTSLKSIESNPNAPGSRSSPQELDTRGL